MGKSRRFVFFSFCSQFFSSFVPLKTGPSPPFLPNAIMNTNCLVLSLVVLVAFLSIEGSFCVFNWATFDHISILVI
jgi:hypothetical protein